VLESGGGVNLTLTKDGHTTHKLELTLSEKTLFPAEQILMYPIPKEKGIYFLHSNKLVGLEPLSVTEKEYEKNSKQYYDYNVIIP
jgi:hypothetical protein